MVRGSHQYDNLTSKELEELSRKYSQELMRYSQSSAVQERPVQHHENRPTVRPEPPMGPGPQIPSPPPTVRPEPPMGPGPQIPSPPPTVRPEPPMRPVYPLPFPLPPIRPDTLGPGPQVTQSNNTRPPMIHLPWPFNEPADSENPPEIIIPDSARNQYNRSDPMPRGEFDGEGTMEPDPPGNTGNPRQPNPPPVPVPVDSSYENTPEIVEDTNEESMDDTALEDPPTVEPLVPPDAKEPGEYTDTGSIEVYVYTARTAIPLQDAQVKVSRPAGDDGREELLRVMRTDMNGKTPIMEVPAPSREYAQQPSDILPFAVYLVQIDLEGYYTMIRQVEIFGGSKSILPVEMIPLKDTDMM